MARAVGESNQWYSIEKVLECPVCLEIPQSSILQCSTGHHICVDCRNKVPVCPSCKARFLETRNYLAEGVANKLEEIKLFIEDEIENIKLDNKRESTSTCTQTDFEFEVPKSKTSSATQTGEIARTDTENRKAKGTAPSAPFYPCQIGSCMFKSFYIRLLYHVAEYHRDTFYEVQELHGQFTESCVITTHTLPKSYDFAFLKNGNDLFFFNISVYGHGNLKAHVLLVKKPEIANLFHYDLAIKNGAHQVTRHGKVIPCGTSTATICPNNVWLKNDQLFGTAKFLEVTITIRKCACKKFTENVATVNP